MKKKKNDERPPGLGVKCFDAIYKSQSVTNCAVVDRSGSADTQNYVYVIFNTTHIRIIVYSPLLRYATQETRPSRRTVLRISSVSPTRVIRAEHR